MRAAKLAGRPANEGAVALSVLSDGSNGSGVRAALVELACETDFVSRGELFSKLAADIAHTAAFLAERSGPSLHVPIDVSTFGDAPCIDSSGNSSHTVTEAIHTTMAKVSENLALRRAVAFVEPPSDTNSTVALGSYVHGSTSAFPSLGRIGCVATVQLTGTRPQDPEFNKSFSSLRRAIARQIVGMNVDTVTSTESIQDPDPSSSVLYHQPFVMLPGAPENETVEQALQSWGKTWNVGISVGGFTKWTRNEPSMS